MKKNLSIDGLDLSKEKTDTKTTIAFIIAAFNIICPLFLSVILGLALMWIILRLIS